MGSKSKQKGNRYERRCAKLLSEFTNVNFRKVPASGGFNKFGGQVVAEHAFSGDVICDKKEFIFSVEAKSQKAFSFVAMLKSPETALFTKWWEQCVEDATRVCKLPLLMFKPDNQEDFVALTIGGVVELGVPSTTPHFAAEIYPMIKLPTPKIFRWKTLISGIKPDKMFGG
jgi:hypothetical protein